MSFSTVQDAVDAIARGDVVIVVDAEERENEGDFICAAEKATPENINFIMRGCGVLCVPILPEVRDRLELVPITEQNNAPLGTAFLTPIDHRTGRTGITAQERSRTILEMVNPSSSAAEFVRPGHVYPLQAKEGGVLRRAGHTEASVDLARMAGLKPAGVLCEVLNDQGARASREELFEIARRNQLEIISIEQLIAHRRVAEKLVSRAAECELPTKNGHFRLIAYDVKYENQNPLALVLGEPDQIPGPPLVRLHSSCFTGDLIESLRCDCGDQLKMAMEMIGQEKTGVLIYLPQEGRGIGLVEKIRAYSLQDQGRDTVEANQMLGFKADLREYGIGIQILKDLGLRKIRLLTNNPKKTDAPIYDGFDLEVIDQVPIIAASNPFNEHYLATKRDKLGHHLP